MTPTTPYLVRAIFEWCTDQGFTPHLLVDASHESVIVPRQLVENDSIVLNIEPSAVRNLDISNDWVLFNARFSGQAMDISVPMSAVRAIFARENGVGCAFEATSEDSSQQDEEAADIKAIDKAPPPKKNKQKPKARKSSDSQPFLKLVD